MENAVVRFKQRNVLTRVRLTLRQDFFEYSIAPGRGARTGFNAKYETLPNAFDYRTFRPKSMFMRIVLLIMWIFIVSHLVTDDRSDFTFIGFILVFGAVCAALGYGFKFLFKKEYTVLATATGNLLIVKDRQHDRIITELQARRMSALKKFVVVDKLQDPWKEIKKFKWLRDQSVISPQEFDMYADLILSPSDFALKADAPIDRPILH